MDLSPFQDSGDEFFDFRDFELGCSTALESSDNAVFGADLLHWQRDDSEFDRSEESKDSGYYSPGWGAVSSSNIEATGISGAAIILKYPDVDRCISAFVGDLRRHVPDAWGFGESDRNDVSSILGSLLPRFAIKVGYEGSGILRRWLMYLVYRFLGSVNIPRASHGRIANMCVYPNLAKLLDESNPGAFQLPITPASIQQRDHSTVMGVRLMTICPTSKSPGVTSHLSSASY